MNVFRLAGDMMHLLSIIVLLLKITGIKSCRGTYLDAFVCRADRRLAQPEDGSLSSTTLLLLLYAGISLKTQELYLLVFITRYLDIFTNFVSL
jgi:ER lumen protein retaining receptor